MGLGSYRSIVIDNGEMLSWVPRTELWSYAKVIVFLTIEPFLKFKSLKTIIYKYICINYFLLLDLDVYYCIIFSIFNLF